MNSNLSLLPNALSLITYSVSLTIKHSICCIHYTQGKIFWPEVVILAPRRLRQKNSYYKSEASMGFRVRLSQNKPLKNERNLGTTQYPIILVGGDRWVLGACWSPYSPMAHTYACLYTRTHEHTHAHSLAKQNLKSPLVCPGIY